MPNPSPIHLPAAGRPDTLRIIAIGHPVVVENFVQTQHRLGYAEVREWSKPLPTKNSGEIMRILTRRLRLEP